MGWMSNPEDDSGLAAEVCYISACQQLPWRHHVTTYSIAVYPAECCLPGSVDERAVCVREETTLFWREILTSVASLDLLYLSKSPHCYVLREILSGLVLKAFEPYLGYLNTVKKYVVRALGGAKVPRLYRFIVIYLHDSLVGCGLVSNPHLFIFF